MKTKYLIIQIMAVAMLNFSLNSCDLEVIPPTEIASSGIDPNDYAVLQSILNGGYASVLETEYMRNKWFYGEHGGDNNALSGNSDTQRYAYNYEHSQVCVLAYNAWRYAYQVIYSANLIIGIVEDDQLDYNGNPETSFIQLKAEALFLRAESHWFLVNQWGRPYQQNPTTNLGVPIVLSHDPDQLFDRSRATVAETYNQIITDLKHAITLFEKVQAAPKNSCYASKEVCEAFLSRVYLYMDDLDNAFSYAQKVIDSGRYEMASGEDHLTYPTRVPEATKETIFAWKHTPSDNRNADSVGSMYYSREGSGWAEIYCSMDFYWLVRHYPDDIRNGFLEPQFSVGFDPDNEPLSEEEYNAYTDAQMALPAEQRMLVYQMRGNCNRIYVTKQIGQEGYINLSSPVMFRLAEMYLNQAEIYAKQGRNQEAIEIVNMIRQRAGLSGGALYNGTGTIDGWRQHDSVLDVVLEERRLELAFEAHRKYDIFRNGKTLDKGRPIEFHGRRVVEPDHPRVVLYIPQREMQINSNLVDNPETTPNHPTGLPTIYR